MGRMAAHSMTFPTPIQVPGDRSGPYRVLALGAHPDDIEIGCAATLMRLLDDAGVAAVRWVVLTGTANRADEARASAAALAGDTPLEVTVEAFADGFLPWKGDEVKTYLEGLKAFAPDLVFTHRLEDAHQDHRLVAELTWQTFREAMIYEYEITKYEGDLGHPNLYVSVSESLAQRKVEHLQRHFPSQHGRQWFSADTFRALLRLRGIEANSPTGLAEGFTCRKMRL
jgi:LmbE family N-acetylglucosaminyl deacetylase